MPERRGTVSHLNTLFIGNSFTARNDMPGLIAKLANAAGKTFDHRLISVGGASLRTHWNKGDAADAIRRGKYDYVVLQEQSTLPVKNARRMHENVRLFDEVIKKAGSRTALYLTWARRHAPQTQDLITRAYQTIGEELDATVIPVGVAWEKLLREADPPELYDRDGSHPTPAGSYLAACVAFAALFREKPAPIGDVAGLSESDATRLAKAAGKIL